MSRPSRPRSLLAGLLLLAGWGPAWGEEDTWTRRADRETLDILHTLITEEVKAIRPCELSDSWVADRPLDYASARKYLGLNLRVDIMASHDGRGPTDVLAPDPAMLRNFCDEETFRSRRKQRFEDFSAGRIEGDVPRHGRPGREVKARRVAFGRPVFDARFRTAAVFAEFNIVTRWRNPEGPTKSPESYLPNGIRKRDDVFMSGIRYIYRKRETVWIKIDEQVEFRAE